MTRRTLNQKEQAMVKIRLNCFRYYFPNSENHTRLENAKTLVKKKKNGKAELKRSIEKTDKLIDTKKRPTTYFLNNINRM